MEPAERVQKGRTKRKHPERRRVYSADFKVQVVKKYLEESVPVLVIQQECRLSGMVGRL